MQVCGELIDSPLAMSRIIVAHTHINSARVHLFFACNEYVIPLSELRIPYFFVNRTLRRIKSSLEALVMQIEVHTFAIIKRFFRNWANYDLSW